ncbi:hypothetical protein DY000_02037684 [Brassica cretica]|uniref:Methyltransferase n=1 Tax=Brassica cretica TaxID=69181 RepID=A0ABQ7BCF3_BRACR|nr:hypothetical protein DY000_02037684 [Brassica cretica]
MADWAPIIVGVILFVILSWTSLLTAPNQPRSRLRYPQEEESKWIGVEPVKGGLVVKMGDSVQKYNTPCGLEQDAPPCLSRKFLRPSQEHSDQPVDWRQGPPIYRRLAWEEYLVANPKHFNKTLTLCRC